MSTGTAPEALARLQRQFAAHIRDPASAPAPVDIEDRRMAVYRELFFNNLRGFLEANFPVLRSLHEDAAWNELCRDFYRDFRAQTPLFPEIPREFLRYLREHRQGHDSDPPFMLELAHYEWVELALSLDEADPEAIAADAEGGLLTGVPVLSPLAWPLRYTWPVHRISAEYEPQSAPGEATHLLVYRRRDYAVRFMHLNPVAALLLQRLQANEGHTGLELLTAIADEIDHPNPNTVIETGETLMKGLKDKGIILGTRCD
ncbi:MAG: putative DNA-binding domain-containing protein [Lysobacterales bacterium]